MVAKVDVQYLRCDRRARKQGVHTVGSRKTKRGIKISRRGIKSEPSTAVKADENGLTVPSIDTVSLVSAVVAAPIYGTHIVYHRA
jgi:hypothetical protein